MLDPTIKLYDAVRITELRQPVRSDLGAGDIRKPQVGDVAWVIEIYENPPGYELECSDKDGTTEWLQGFGAEEIKLEKLVKHSAHRAWHVRFGAHPVLHDSLRLSPPGDLLCLN